MSYVDNGQAGSVTASPGQYWTIEVTSPVSGRTDQPEFSINQWFRLAPSLDQSIELEPPDFYTQSIAIADGSRQSGGRYGEAVWIDSGGNTVAAMTVVNVGHITAHVYINWLSVPELGE